MHIPRSEYPRPQFQRPEWLCLNGDWQFEIDHGNSGLERGLLDRELKETIRIPFCPESSLSGVEYTDFMAAVWYRRIVTIPESWVGKRVLLHFQAVDYDATVWVNGIEVARHRGGFSPITCDLKGIAEAGKSITIVVRARDYATSPQPRGKQSPQYANFGCLYTRTTGIWQTVWMEPVPDVYLLRPRLTPDVANSLIRIEQPLSNNVAGMKLRVSLKDDQGVICTKECSAEYDFSPTLDLLIPANRVHLWQPEAAFLYDVEIALIDTNGQIVDHATSYTGLRSVSIEGKAIKINGKPVYQRLVLDQGFYPDGILTAPSDDALRQDIEYSLKVGFNGARLHQKVFEERFLYWADKLGYMVWGEFPDWGCGGLGPNTDHQKPGATYITQWLEVIQRDYSHPSIVGWCPMNETWQVLTDHITVLDDVMRGMFLATKALDTTRPVLDTSGYSHRVPETDVFDCHDYDQNVETFKAHHQSVAEGKPYYNTVENDKAISIPYRGQPFFVSEFGGIWWNPDAKPGEDSWGYGDRPTSLEAFYTRFEGMCNALLENSAMFGYCYTQLTDVFQEQNGIFKFDRTPKFDAQKLWKIQRQKAAIEK